jgi:hypothetical protein
VVSYNKYPLVLRTSPSSRLGRSLQPNHAHSRSKRNRKESPGPPHRSGTTRFPLSLIIDTTDSCCAAGSADIVGWTASASLVLAAHEPATRTCTLILRACDCSRGSSLSTVVVEVDAATSPPTPAIVTPFETRAVLSPVGQDVVSQLRPTRQQPPK